MRNMNKNSILLSNMLLTFFLFSKKYEYMQITKVKMKAKSEFLIPIISFVSILNPFVQNEMNSIILHCLLLPYKTIDIMSNIIPIIIAVRLNILYFFYKFSGIPAPNFTLRNILYNNRTCCNY